MKNQIYTGIATRCQDSGKSLITIALAEVLANRGEKVFLLDTDTENADNEGTSYQFLSSRCGDRGFQFGNLEQADSIDKAKRVLMDCSRNPAEAVIDAIKGDCSLVFIPVNSTPKGKADGAKLYRELLGTGTRAVIVPNLVKGGNADEIISHFSALAPEIGPSIPHCAVAADLIKTGLPLAWCKPSDQKAVSEFSDAIELLADRIIHTVAEQPLKAVENAA